MVHGFKLLHVSNVSHCGIKLILRIELILRINLEYSELKKLEICTFKILFQLNQHQVVIVMERV